MEKCIYCEEIYDLEDSHAEKKMCFCSITCEEQATKMNDEEKEMLVWLNHEVCSKCGITPLTEDTPFYHCEQCRK